eukprot:scaffold88170_cov51-Phaeocystis_antarctica.AAC.2
MCTHCALSASALLSSEAATLCTIASDAASDAASAPLHPIRRRSTGALAHWGIGASSLLANACKTSRQWSRTMASSECLGGRGMTPCASAGHSCSARRCPTGLVSVTGVMHTAHGLAVI